MCEVLNISVEPMTEADIADSVKLIAASMNQDEAEWARETMDFHFKCKISGLNSGREYYVWRYNNKIQGLVGLHRYLWGPKENVWLSWFAVHPEHHGKGAGSALMDAIEKQAKEAGFKKFLIETYDSPAFKKARSFYSAKGFLKIGKIKGYLPDDSAMIVFGKSIV